MNSRSLNGTQSYNPVVNCRRNIDNFSKRINTKIFNLDGSFIQWVWGDATMTERIQWIFLECDLKQKFMNNELHGCCLMSSVAIIRLHLPLITFVIFVFRKLLTWLVAIFNAFLFDKNYLTALFSTYVSPNFPFLSIQPRSALFENL